MAQNLSNLTVGSLVKFGMYSVEGETAQPIIWRVVAKNHGGYPTNSVTLWTDRSIDLRAFDAWETTSVHGENGNGNCEYNVSNIGQWLCSDAPAGEWYKKISSGDNPPSSLYIVAYYSSDKTPYDNRPGFLNLFTAHEKNAILDTSIYTANMTGGTSGGYVTRKVFLPSTTEVCGVSAVVAEGARWAGTNVYWGGITEQARLNTKSQYKPGSAADGWDYWTRSASTSGRTVRCVNKLGSLVEASACVGYIGVRPVVNLSSACVVSDTTDSDGCYTMIWNSAPSTPTTLNVPTIYGGQPNTISWSSSTDPDGDSVSYELGCSYSGGAFSVIYTGTSRTYNHTVPYGTASVQYRVRAVDSQGAYSGYTTSASVSVVNNKAPVISGSDGNLGVKTSGFTQTYSVTDEDGGSVTVSEAIDGVQIRAYIVTLGATNTVSITGMEWLKLINGTHTLTITATDPKGAKTVRTYTFAKLVTKCTVTTSPMEASSMPTRISLSVTKNIPSQAIFKVEVCNNGNDASPAWEDATGSVKSDMVHLFSNKSKTATAWAVRIRVTVDRNNSEGSCYISAIGGNFE